MNDKIRVSIISNEHGNIGRITLNKPKALNALDLDMVNAMLVQLQAWHDDTSIAAVFIDSEHEKAFCAGGDIVSMYKAMKEMPSDNTQEAPPFIARFFEQEYRLDYCIHTYPKPLVCWGDGIVMGGGLGVFSGANIKIVTQNTRVAMPEITIGLFPDVGASYFLNRMPAGIGRFLGLGAASINGHDCINIGLANFLLCHETKQSVLELLSSLDTVNHASLTALFSDLASKENNLTQAGLLDGLYEDLAVLDNCVDLEGIHAVLSEISQANSHSKIVSKALTNFEKGSPITAHLVLSQLDRAKHSSLAECFQMELSMAYQCSLSGEFEEGVRALLIDKDNQPKWRYTHYSQVQANMIDAHFSYFNTKENPLANLVSEFGEYNG